MKTTNLEVAMKLAKILNKPLEEFYEQPEGQDSKQETEEQVETENVDVSSEIIDDIQEIRVSEKKQIRTVLYKLERDTTKDSEYMQLYGGTISDNGKLIGDHRQMTRKEYLSTTKSLTHKDVLNSPLLYLMFRAEGQSEGHFVQWLESFPKE